MVTTCHKHALYAYLYGLVGVVLFVGSALGSVGADFADKVIAGPILYIICLLLTWIIAFWILAFEGFGHNITKHIAAGTLAIVSGMATGVFARKEGLVPAVRRTAVGSSTFLITAALIIYFSKTPCISGWWLVLCAIVSICALLYVAHLGDIDFNVVGDVETAVSDPTLQNMVSVGFLVTLFGYSLSLSRHVCLRSCRGESAEDYVETAMLPYTSLLRLGWKFLKSVAE